MKFEWNSKYTTVSVYTVITFTVCVIILQLLSKITELWGGFLKVVDVLMPVIWGFAIAYLLNPFMKLCERGFKKLLEKKAPRPKLCRGLATASALIFGLAVIAALTGVIVPQVFRSLMGIFNNFTTYVDNITDWADKVLENYPQVRESINEQIHSAESKMIEWINNLIPKMGEVAVKLRDSALNIVGSIGDFLIGFIVAVYFLAGKEHFQAQVKKLCAALLPEKSYHTVLSVSAKTNTKVVSFLSGKIVDSLIIGVICFIAMTVMRIEYAVLISTIIGVTNIIPFFGPIIGAVPSALLLLVSNPSQFLPFVIMVVLLQQFDGNFLGPLIIGDSTGLAPFWVMFAILMGGGMFGFVGMVLGVPFFAVIYELCSELVVTALEKRGLSPKTDDYYPVPVPETEVKRKAVKIFGFTLIPGEDDKQESVKRERSRKKH
ncbi:MAG: AI-2E family transporter [Oscillospiraceae bacterium]|nr:AI-2E family transporter [Oscillospiraceae bacterium]